MIFGRFQRLKDIWIASGVLIVLLMVAGCSTAPPEGKRTFIGKGEEPPTAQPKGLNPLGSLETCGDVNQPPVNGIRVLISRPEQFTREASLMIVLLQESMAEQADTRERVEMVLSNTPLNNRQEAIQAGRHCRAMVVLWERLGSRTLEITLPEPSRIPLRAIVQDKLCEFGDHIEQLTILDLTIRGLSAVVTNEFDQANGYFLAANRLDDRCFQLPLASPKNPATRTE